MDKLTRIREQLDVIDQQIQDLINQRGQLALEVGRIKKDRGDDVVYYRPEREAQILRAIAERNAGPIDSRIVTQIFSTLMAACLALQKKIKVACLGPAGTFSQVATLKHFGSEIEPVFAESIEQVFYLVNSNQVDYGVVPIENSTTGVIDITLNALVNSAQSLCGEIILPIHHNLLSKNPDIKTIKRVYAHEQSFAQCRNWLQTHLPTAEKITVSSNGAAAKRAQEEDEAAAIASDIAAEIYHLEKIADRVEDQPNNQTRFLIIGQQKVPSSGIDKTTLLITTPHTPGSLIKLIQPFANQGINITWIESRPYQHQIWNYLFFLDIEGHQDVSPVKEALQQIAAQPVKLTVLGSYPKATT